jgi:hypothetical protein
MKKQVLFMVVFLAAVGLFAGVVASNALANSGYTVPCGGCHGTAGPAPTVTLVSNSGTTATYSFYSATSFQWAVFKTSDSTFIDGTNTSGHGSVGNTATTGTFTVPVGTTYTVYATYGPGFGGANGAQVDVSPQGAANFTITPSAGANGTIDPATAQAVASGGNATFTMTPAANYKVADVLVDGVSVGAVPTYTFSNVTASHTIAASFAPQAGTTFTITPTAGANGTITPDGAQTIATGADLAFAIKPASGYYIDTLKVDGTAVQPVASYTFKNVTANHTIEATFAKTPILCTITTTVVGGYGGSFVPMFPVYTLVPSAGITYYFVPDDGFHIDSVTVNGWPVTLDSDDNSYTFSNIDRNTTCSVKFVPNTWTITPSVSGKGAISPSGAKTVSEGTSVTCAFTPDAGNKLSDVLVDGQSVGVPSTYTFDDVSANHTIQAKFVTASSNFTITPSVTAGQGSILPATAFTVVSSSNLTVYFVPSDGYQVGTVTVDGSAVDASTWNDDNSYTFSNVTANHTISVAFAQVAPIVTYTITPTAGQHGTISPDAPATVTSGDDATFAITPDAGYKIADVVVDGQSKGAVATYTFTGVAANHTISASFAWIKLPTSAMVKASAKTVKLKGYAKLTGRVTGGTFSNASIRYEVKKPGQKAYKLLKTVKLSSTGVATYKCKVTVKGSWYYRVKFLGNAVYLPSSAKAIRVVVK